MAFSPKYWLTSTSSLWSLVIVFVLCVQLPLELNVVLAAANTGPDRISSSSSSNVGSSLGSHPKSPYNNQQHHSTKTFNSNSNNQNGGGGNSDNFSDINNGDSFSSSSRASGGNNSFNHSTSSSSSASAASAQQQRFGYPGTTASIDHQNLNSSSSTVKTDPERPCITTTENGKTMCRRGSGIDMKMLSLQMIRHDILRKLRMDENRLPNITGRGFPIPPDYINEFIDMQSDSPRDDYDDDHATTEKIIAFSRIQPLKISTKETRGVYYFTFSDKLSNMKIEKASLYIHVRTSNSYPHPYYPNHHNNEKKFVNFTIRLMEFVPQKKGESPMSINYGYFKPTFRQTGDTGHGSGHGYIRQGKSKWVQIDVRDALSKWIAGAAPSSSSTKIGLVIEAIDPNGQDVSQDVTIVSSNEMDVNSNPFIEVHVSEKGKSRPPRNIGMTCDENSQETRCCRYPLTVDFEDFGWDWIIAPKKYDANYCSGECPYAFLQKYPHNHIVQQAIPTGVGGPCCAARKMSSISMLYFDSDSNIVFSVLPGMVVDRCGCS